MPAPLKVECEPVKWRIRSDDMDLLRTLFPEGKVNEVARDALHAFCNALRQRHFGRAE